MKSFFLLIVISFCGLNNSKQTDSGLELISKIVHEDKFTISIERFDLGYFHNLEHYHFEKSDSNLVVTHKQTICNWDDSILNSTIINHSFIDTLESFCKEIKSFEITHPRKYRRLFNNNGVHDFIYVHSSIDTIVIPDVYFKAMDELNVLVKRNVKKQ